MRFTVILAVAAILTPAALSAHPAGAPGVANASATTDLAAAKKKKPKKKTEENMKAAPGTGPSGPPATKY